MAYLGCGALFPRGRWRHRGTLYIFSVCSPLHFPFVFNANFSPLIVMMWYSQCRPAFFWFVSFVVQAGNTKRSKTRRDRHRRRDNYNRYRAARIGMARRSIQCASSVRRAYQVHSSTLQYVMPFECSAVPCSAMLFECSAAQCSVPVQYSIGQMRIDYIAATISSSAGSSFGRRDRARIGWRNSIDYRRFQGGGTRVEKGGSRRRPPRPMEAKVKVKRKTRSFGSRSETAYQAFREPLLADQAINQSANPSARPVKFGHRLMRTWLEL